jgi:UDP:flavonoid glycosyltransferase YjiC (YdhE family)
VRKGLAVRVTKSKNPSKKVQEAIQLLLQDEEVKYKAKEFSKVMEKWDGPKIAADLLYKEFGK